MKYLKIIIFLNVYNKIMPESQGFKLTVRLVQFI
jgi:hypothetical protein